VATFSSYGVAIRYVLPVFMDVVMFSYQGTNGRIKHDDIRLGEFARWRYQLDFRQLQCLVEFVRMQHRGRSLLSTIALLYYVAFLISRCNLFTSQVSDIELRWQPVFVLN